MSDGSTAAAAHGTGPSHSLSRWCSCRALWSSVYDRGQRRAAQRRPLAVCSVEYGLFWLLFLARGPRIRPRMWVVGGSSSRSHAKELKALSVKLATDPLAVSSSSSNGRIRFLAGSDLLPIVFNKTKYSWPNLCLCSSIHLVLVSSTNT